MLLQYQAYPRVGHLEVLYLINDYLKSHMKMGRVVYDSMDRNVDLLVLNNNAYWTEFYGDFEEDLTPKIPEPRGMAVSIYLFVDANHAVNFMKRRSNTGIIMFIKNTPVLWFSKKQNMVKVATFGCKLVSFRIFKDMIVA